jgi:hypothetical protein
MLATPVANPAQPTEKVEPAVLPVAPEVQPAPAEAPAAAAAPAQDTVVEEQAIEAPLECEDPVVEQLATGHQSEKQLNLYRRSASNILAFFQPDKVLGTWLDTAERNKNAAGLQKLINSLMLPNKEAFNTTVITIMEREKNNGQLSDGSLTDKNCINFIFDIIQPKVTPEANTAITTCIANLYKIQPDFIKDDDNLTTLLTRWEAHLNRAPMNTKAIWQALEPLSKIYYLKFMSFYFFAQDTLKTIPPISLAPAAN